MESTAHNMIDEKVLKNNLRVVFYDQSRPVAVGRWQVAVCISISIKIVAEFFMDCPDPMAAYSEFTAAHGMTLEFQQIKVRNFVAEEEKATLITTMKKEFLESNTAYLENPAFPSKFVMKAYSDWKEKNAWQEAYHAALSQAAD